MKLRELIAKPLDGYTIQELTEVYRVNDDGRKTTSIGYFKDETVARAFSQNQTDANSYEIRKSFVLTNGEVGFLFNGESITLLDDEKEAERARESALAKLSPEDRKLLKI